MQCFFRAAGPSQCSRHSSVGLRETQELSFPLNAQAELAEFLDQQSLVSVLWKDEREGVGRQTFSCALQRDAGGAMAFHPQIQVLYLDAAGNDRVVDSNLVIELECPCLHRQRPRCCAWLRGLVDDPHFDAELSQPESEH